MHIYSIFERVCAQIYLHPGQITAVITKFSFYYQFVCRFKHCLKKRKEKKSPHLSFFLISSLILLIF